MDFINSEFFIIRPFNLMFFIMLAITAGMAFVIIKTNQNKTRAEKRRTIAIIYSLVLVYFVLYKVALYLDKDYSDICANAGVGAFSWWKELPFQLCNINLILIVVAMLTDNRPLTSFVFYMSTIGAIFPLLTPAVGFSGYSILLPRNLGYYITHQFVLIEMPILAGLKLYRPRYSDIIPAAITALVIALSIFVLNSLLRVTGLEPMANYFYLMNTDGNPILDIFWKFIPVQGLYVLPALPLIVLPYMLLLTWLFNLKKKKKK